MSYEAKVIADSISPDEKRVTTFEVTFPRMILAEFNTHRVLSRNSASSRAIPVELQLRRILDDPYLPLKWGINKPGMQAEDVLDPAEQELAESNWLISRDLAVVGAVALVGGVGALKDKDLAGRIGDLNMHYKVPFTALDHPLHKQNANRLLEPFMWHTVIATGTEWENFYALRFNEMAQPEISKTAELMLDAHIASTPQEVGYGEWHLPLVQADERDLSLDALKKISSARCARVSYLTHDGKRDVEKDLYLYNRLLEGGHMSPFEHPAAPLDDAQAHVGNLVGWKSHRQELAHEGNYLEVMLQNGQQVDEKLMAFVGANS